jgi:hypothetical protein
VLLDARIPTRNPKPWEFDDSLPDPEQATWAKISFTVERKGGGVVDAELIRPLDWIESSGIKAGHQLPLNIAELQVVGLAYVTSVEPCPEIASGDGSVITGRFITRQVDRIARVEILGADGKVETIEGTPIHPVWSKDRQDWVPLGELQEGEQLRGDTGKAIVLAATILLRPTPVYNIEVHGEHVYQVGELGVLVHNSNLTCSMLGLDEAKAVVDGTIEVSGEVASVWVQWLGRTSGTKSIGTSAMRNVTANLMETARSMGAKRIHAEAEIKESSGRLARLLERQGWMSYGYGSNLMFLNRIL